MSFKTIIRTFVVGAAAGAAAMYLADPDGGRQRRRELRAKADATAEQFGVDLDSAAQDLRNRAQGVAAEATRAVRDTGPETDRALTDRVRSEVLSDPRFEALNIAVVDGEATVRGVVEPAQARADLVEAIQAVPGVDRVIDLTHPSDTAAPNR